MRCKIALLAFIVTALSSLATDSYGAPGDTLASFNLPAGNSTDFGLSVAVDPTGNIFFTRFGVPKLYKTNASGSTVSSVSISPSIALGEMVWDASSNLLLAGSEDSTPIKGLYSLSPTTGAATNVFVVGPGLTFKVDGLALDGAGTVWYHPDGSSPIYFFLSGNVSGTPDGSIVPKDSANTPISCCISGVEAGSGNTLIVHLFGPPRLLTVDKTTGNYISELPYTPPPNVGQEGISCDTVNFAPKTAVWVRNYGVLTAVEVAPGSCPSGAPVCGDNVVNQSSEQCDGTDLGVCSTGPCQANCTCPFNIGKAKKYKTDMVRAFTDCGAVLSPNSTTASGVSSCVPPVPLSLYSYQQCHGSCQVSIEQRTEVPCSTPPAAGCCNCKIRAKCRGILDPSGTLISGTFASGWTLAIVWRVTGNDPNGAMTVINLPVSVPLNGSGTGRLDIATDCNTIFNALGIGPLPARSSVEIVDVAIVDPDDHRFAVPGFSCCGKF